MRQLTWGQYTAQAADFTFSNIQGKSTVVDGHGTDATESPEHSSYPAIESQGIVNSWQKALYKITLDTLRSMLGHAPVLLQATFNLWEYTLTAGWECDVDFYRFITTPDFGDVNYRYRDVSGAVTWYGDAYSPVPGQDIMSQYFDTFHRDIISTPPTTDYNIHLDVMDELALALIAGRNLMFLGAMREEEEHSSTWEFLCYWSVAGKRPYLDIKYLLPIEFFGATDGGDIDLDHILDASTGLDENRLYLGAVQRGETGTAVKVYVKNLSGATFAHLEVYDDFPEASEPVQTEGAGTGLLHYVQLAESAVSQRYYVKFTSATEFEVKAVAFRDNATSLNPTYGGAGWEGLTSGDWTAPEGGLTIPETAWDTGTGVNDVFEFSVLGNTTLAAWPADANDQVEITFDDAGSADAANWRPICGRRTTSAASVTIDATTKKIPTKAIVSVDWPVGTRAFIADDSTIHHGTVDSADEAEIETAVFTGAGLDDLTSSGNYRGTADKQIRVEIDGTGTPDTFKWSNDGGSTWEATTVNITGAAQELEDGINITFAATTGHTSTDRWDFDAICFGVTLSGLTNDSEAYAVGAKVGTTLPIRALAPAVYTRSNAAAGPSQTPSNRMYLDDTTGIVGTDVLWIQDVENAALTEYATVSAVASTYVDFTANLDNDYGEGALVVKKGSGEDAFWVRPVASVSTDEERKDLRFNVRV